MSFLSADDRAGNRYHFSSLAVYLLDEFDLCNSGITERSLSKNAIPTYKYTSKSLWQSIKRRV
jgi:hypothetical protein